MNANASTCLVGMLMATSLVSGASAMDLTQQHAPSTGTAQAFTLPAFLDGARLPDLQDAWRAHFGAAEESQGTPTVDGAATAAPGTGEEASIDTARAAITRAEQVSREAAAVRERAEELSRRFGAEEPGTAQTASPEAATATPTETASINTDASAAGDKPQPAVKHVLAPADDSPASAPAPAPAAEAEAAKTEAPPTPVAKDTDKAPVIEDMATKPAKPAKRAKPANAAMASTQPATGMYKQPAITPKPADGAPGSDVDPDGMLPGELRAFGWNSQP